MEAANPLRRRKIKRVLRFVMLGLLMSCELPAPSIPGPNLAKRIESADAVIVAKLIRGTTLASGSEVSSDIVLQVDRVLKGNLTPGTEIAAHLEGRGYFIVPNPTQSTIQQPIYGIWFLSSASYPYAVISRDGKYGELYFAPVILPEDAPVGKAGNTPSASVANELISALQWLAAVHGTELSTKAQHEGDADTGKLAGLYFSQFHSLTEDFSALRSSITLPVYRQFALEESPHLRVIGIRGLIAADEPEGVKRAAADWSVIAAGADVQPIIGSLMSYSNAEDPTAVRALGALALRDDAPPGLRGSAVYALRAIHTKETLPALISLLDYKEETVQSYALSGLCLFVRNGPVVNGQSVPSMSWLSSQQPAPFLTPETQPYCSLGGNINPSADLNAYVSFWKSWWSEHRAEIGEP